MKVLRGVYLLRPVATCVDLKGRPFLARRMVGGLALAAGGSDVLGASQVSGRVEPGSPFRRAYIQGGEPSLQHPVLSEGVVDRVVQVIHGPGRANTLLHESWAVDGPGHGFALVAVPQAVGRP